MSFQAYLDAVEDRTGHTPRHIIEQAKAEGFDEPGTKAGDILVWLKDEFDLGRGHGMAIVHVITNGPTISAKHVGSSGMHHDDSDTLWLEGKAARPKP